MARTIVKLTPERFAAARAALAQPCGRCGAPVPPTVIDFHGTAADDITATVLGVCDCEPGWTHVMEKLRVPVDLADLRRWLTGARPANPVR